MLQFASMCCMSLWHLHPLRGDVIVTVVTWGLSNVEIQKPSAQSISSVSSFHCWSIHIPSQKKGAFKA